MSSSTSTKQTARNTNKPDPGNVEFHLDEAGRAKHQQTRPRECRVPPRHNVPATTPARQDGTRPSTVPPPLPPHPPPRLPRVPPLLPLFPPPPHLPPHPPPPLPPP